MPIIIAFASFFILRAFTHHKCGSAYGSIELPYLSAVTLFLLYYLHIMI